MARTINPVATDNIINAAEVGTTITGARSYNESVTLTIGGVVRTAVANGPYGWKYTLVPADIVNMGEGPETITATFSGTVNGTRNITVDTIAPTASVTFTSVLDDMGAIKGNLMDPGTMSPPQVSGAVTDDTTLVLSGDFAGTLGAGEVVAVYDGAVKLGNATVNGATWSYTDTTLAGGDTVNYSVHVEDLAGNFTSTASFSTTVRPPTATVTGITDDTLPQPGGVGTSVTVVKGGVTNDLTPLIKGALSASLVEGESVHVYRTNLSSGVTVDLGVATVTGTSWEFTDSGLVDGATYRYAARVRDTAGGISASGTGYMITVDASIAAPVVTGVSDDRGSSTTDGITSDRTLYIKGTADAGATVTVFKDGISLGTTVVNGSGAWVFDPSATFIGQINQGSSVLIVNAALAGIIRVGMEFTGSSQMPAGTYITSLGTGTGGVGTYNLSTVNPTGDWLYGTMKGQEILTDGSTYLFTAQQTDPAGNISATSAPFTVKMDTAGPVTTTMITAVSDDVGAIQGNLASGSYTDDTTPTLTGSISAPLGSDANGPYVVAVYDGASRLGTATMVDPTHWSFIDGVSRTLYNGQAVSYTARVEDVAGNGLGSAAITTTIDTLAPTATSNGFAVIDNVGIIQGNLTHLGVTNDPTPTLTGSISGFFGLNDKLVVYDGASKLGYAAVVVTNIYNPSGAFIIGQSVDWSFTDVPRAHGTTLNYSVRIEDIAGNLGATSAVFTTTVDTVAPTTTAAVTSVTDDVLLVTGTIPSGWDTNDATPLVGGTISAALIVGEESVHVYRDGVYVGTATVDNTLLTWTFADNLPGEGTYTYTARVHDVAGNQSLVGTPYSVNLYTTPAIVVSDNHSSLTEVIYTFSKALDGTSIPATTDFVYELNGNTVLLNPTAVGISGALTLTLNSLLTDVVEISYTPGGNPLYDAVGNPIGSMHLISGGGNPDLIDTTYTTTGTDVIWGGAGADTIDGSGGDDIYAYNTMTDFVATNLVVDAISDTGGSAFDQIQVAGAISLVGADTLTGVAGVELLVATKQNTANLVHTIDLTTPGNQGSITTIDLSGDTGATSDATITLTGLTADMTLKGVNGVSSTNSLTGGSGADTITGGAGNDVITGGAGIDVLDGGKGNDTFVYAALADYYAANAVVDSIAGGVGIDTIRVAEAITIGTAGTLANVNTVEQLVAAAYNGPTAQAHSIALNSNAKLGSITTIDLSADAFAASSAVIDLSGTSVAMTLKGVGAGTNTLTGGTKGDTLVGGTGSDTFAYASYVGFIAGGAVIDSISGDAGGIDKIQLGSNILLTTADNLTGAVGVEQLVAKANAFVDQYHNIRIDSNTKLGSITAIDLSADASISVAVIDLTGVTSPVTITGVNGAYGPPIDRFTPFSYFTGNTIIGGSGADTLIGGAGDDTFIFTSKAALMVDSIVGGANGYFGWVQGNQGHYGGYDQIQLGGQINLTTADNLSTRMSGVEQLSAATQNTSVFNHSIVNPNLGAIERIDLSGDTNAGSTGVINMSGWNSSRLLQGVSAGKNTITSGNGNDTISGGSDIDVLTGGGGNDGFIYASSSDFIVGGAVEDLVTGGADFGHSWDGTRWTEGDWIQVGGSISITTADTLARATTVEVLQAELQSAFTHWHSIKIDTNAKLSNFKIIDLSNDANVYSTALIDLTGVTAAVTLTGVVEGANTLAGGSGIDTLTGGAGNDTFYFATMAAFITGTNVVDSISGGGNTADKIQIAGNINLTAADTLVRALAIEQLVAAAQNTAPLTHSILINDATNVKLSAIRTIDLSGDTGANSAATVDLTGVTAAMIIMGVNGLNSTNTLTGGDGNDTIIGGAGVDSITAGPGNDSVIGGDGNDSFTFVSGTGLTSLDTVDGGAGTDTLVLTGTTPFTATDFNNVSNIEVIALGSPGTAVSITTVDATVAAGTAMALDASASSSLYFNGAAETDGAFIITGGSGNDTIIGGNWVAGGDTLDGGAGDDTFVYSTLAAFVSPGAVVDSITGGAHTTGDRIEVAGAINLTTADSLARVNTVEILAAATQNILNRSHFIAMNDTSLSGSGIDTINLSGDGNSISYAAVDLTGVTAGMTVIGLSAGFNDLTGGSGADTLTGGSNADSFIYASMAAFASPTAVIDSITGSGGTDTIKIAGAIGLDAGVFLANVNTVEILAAATGTDLSHSIVISNASLSTSGIRTIDLSGTTTNLTSTVDLTGVLADMTIIGTLGTGVNTLTGG